MELTIIQWASAIIGITSCFLLTVVPEKVLLSMFLSVISCSLVALYSILTGSYAIFLSQAIYAILYAYGLFNWKNKKVK